MVRRIIFFFFLLIASLGWTRPRYGTYSLFPQGSTRVMAMGGAFTGLADDASAIEHNPAGLVKSKRLFSVSSTHNYVNDAAVFQTGDSNRWSNSYRFQYESVAVNLGRFAFAVGETQPFQVPNIYMNDSGMLKHLVNLNISSLDFAIAAALSNELSLGVSFHQERLLEHYEEIGYWGNGVPQVVEDTEKQNFMSIGLSYWSNETLV